MEPGDSRLTDTLSMLMAHPEMLRGFASLIGGMGAGGRNGDSGISDTGRQPTAGDRKPGVGGTGGDSGAESSGTGDRRPHGNGQFSDPRQPSGEGQPFSGEPPFSDRRSPGDRQSSYDRQSSRDRLSEIIDSVVAQGNAASAGDRATFSADAGADETGGYGGESAGGAGADGASVAAGGGSGGNSGGKRQFRLPGDKRLTLLVALKPYLSPRRAAAVDSMVRFGKIGELLEGFLPGNGGK